MAMTNTQRKRTLKRLMRIEAACLDILKDDALLPGYVVESIQRVINMVYRTRVEFDNES